MKYSKDLNIRELIKTVVVPYEYAADKENPLSWCGYFTVSPYQEWIWIDEELNKLSELELWKLYALCADHWEKSYIEWYHKAKANANEYESLEKKGLLLKLPVPIGTPCYNIAFCGITSKTRWKIEERPFKIEDINWVGIFIFFTKEKAETKLQEFLSNP